MDVCVRLLGRFELTCDGAVVIDGAWKPAKAAAIVKILALREGRSMHRDQLIAALWPEADAEAGTNSLYKNLHELRKTIRKAGGPRDVVHLNHPAIALAPYVRVDLDEVRRLAAAATDASAGSTDLDGVLAVSGEELLPDDVYEPWSEPYRSDLRLQTTGFRMRLAAMRLAAGEFDEAVAHYARALAADELLEEAHRGLMRAYAGDGRRDLALRQYDRCKDILAAELDAAPSEETEALATDIRATTARNRAEEDIAEQVRAGDAAMRRHAYGEAVAAYRQGIERLRASGDDDERESELWLKLARATSGTGAPMEVADCCRRAAELAERAGAFDRLAHALVEFQNATDATPDNHAGHREATELIESALARLPAEATASRAWLLAAGARPLAASSRPENERHTTGRLSMAGGPDPEIEQRLREAVRLARGAGSRELLAYALTRLRTYITSPDTLEERLDLTREMIDATATSRNAISRFEAQLFRHEDLLESGDVDGARIQARAMRRLGDSINASGILAVALSLQATHATADGSLREGRRLLRESHEQDSALGTTSNSQNRFGAQLLALRWHEGRIGEMEAGLRRAVDVFPRQAGMRAALAFVYVETGQADSARAELERLLEQPVEAIPKDFFWWFTCVFMSHTAIAVGVTDTARSLYALMRPYAQRNAASAGAVSFGSAELILALLAAFLQERDVAERHFEAALAFNVRTRQRVWTARTQFHFADMLLSAGRAEDGKRAQELARVARADAQEIGMAGLLAQLSLPPFA